MKTFLLPIIETHNSIRCECCGEPSDRSAILKTEYTDGRPTVATVLCPNCAMPLSEFRDRLGVQLT